MTNTATARILIVDDEAAHMKALCDTLRGEGYDTVGCTAPKPALETLKTQKFELLLADLMMPDIDGIGLLRAALAVDPDLVGIIMTGEGTISSAVEAMKAGALDYILKPFKLSVVLPVLSRALAVRRLRLRNAALEQRVRERTAELEAANQELEAFSYSISHDLRAPLRAVSGFASILVSKHAAEMSDEARRLLTFVTGNAQRMEQLVDDLLRLSQLGRQTLSKRPVRTRAIVEQVLQELRASNGGRTVDVRVGDVPDTVGDVGLRTQVFANLLSNAFKFTREREDAIVEVDCRAQDGERVWFVRDNGAGFDMKHAEKLFGVFQRLHTIDQFEGTGVGLSIVQRIVQRHGGRIWAEAAVGRGATFYFTLPD